jgi:hypothetical protein
MGKTKITLKDGDAALVLRTDNTISMYLPVSEDEDEEISTQIKIISGVAALLDRNSDELFTLIDNVIEEMIKEGEKLKH